MRTHCVRNARNDSIFFCMAFFPCTGSAFPAREVLSGCLKLLSLLIAHYSLLITHCSLLIAHCPLLIAHCSLFSPKPLA
ncbi:MAG: hypothetical protein J6U05_02415 [Neisseriaceae bacterium]|nr:hypothetical protein [Neisseriaceae bacterium]MBO7554409.1 hypothetical protein [Neisseriaceae bacterium]